MDHDRIIYAFAETYEGDYDIVINPGQEKNEDVDGKYPDIIFRKKGEKDIEAIFEVDVQDYIEESEQWKEYSELGYTLILIIPEKDLSIVQTLIEM